MLHPIYEFRGICKSCTPERATKVREGTHALSMLTTFMSGILAKFFRLLWRRLESDFIEAMLSMVQLYAKKSGRAVAGVDEGAIDNTCVFRSSLGGHKDVDTWRFVC